MVYYPSINHVIEAAARKLKHTGVVTNTKSWHSKPVTEPFLEILNFDFEVDMPQTKQDLKSALSCNQPWSEDHFQERVCGLPLNPGEQYKNWPYYVANKDNDHYRTHKEQFSHSYMERYWPRHAGKQSTEIVPGAAISRDEPNEGIRYEYGDLMDVVNLLHKDPETRQAYLPVWFPEDTGVVHGERVPCSLGYHFIQRGGYLHINYYIRSCDFARHFKDDVYLTIRLAQWVLENLKGMAPDWRAVSLGRLKMVITSLHLFKKESKLLLK